MSGRRLDSAGLAALERALADPYVVARYAARLWHGACDTRPDTGAELFSREGPDWLIAPVPEVADAWRVEHDPIRGVPEPAERLML